MVRLFKKSILRLLLGWLAANLVIVSIPRCDIIFDLFQQVLHKPTPTMAAHCAQTAEKTSGSAISQQHLCECSLARFMAVALPHIDKEPVVTQEPRATVLDISPYHFSVIHITSSLDTPPPRFA